MAKVVMYYSQECPFCRNAEKLLNAKGASIEKRNIDNNDAVLQEMVKLTGRDSVPQVFINDRHIGGFDDLSELDMDDELEPLLK